MMKIMVFDTETTGLPLWKEPSEHPDQPHLVQYTAMLCEGSPENELDYCNLILRPDGWTIPEEVAKLHGITQEIALRDGVPEAEAVGAFLLMADKADLVCAFGIDFDMRLMRIAMLRNGIDKQNSNSIVQRFRTHCVMRQATPLCKLPPTDKMMASGRLTFKTPNLTEAVKCLLGEDLEGAHDSRVDVLATTRLYFHMNPAKAAA